MSFNRSVNARISLDVFQQEGLENPDGWGVAAFPKGSLQIYKEPFPAVDSKLYDFLETHLESSIFISHVRRSTRGMRSYINTHPFYRQLALGSNRVELCLAHNGTLANFNQLETGSYRPIGDTDSEHLLCHLIHYLSHLNFNRWSNRVFEMLAKRLREINRNFGTLNCIFSDGALLFCYSDITGHNEGLRFVTRKHPFGIIRLKSRDRGSASIRISTQSNDNGGPLVNLDRIKARDSMGVIFSTATLTDEDWQPVGDGSLIVARNGIIIYCYK